MNFEDVELEDLSTNSNDKTKLLKKNENENENENENDSLMVSCYIAYFIIVVCILIFFTKSLIELLCYNNKK